MAKNEKAEPTPTAEDDAAKEEEIKPVEETTEAQKKPASCGFCVYLGPSIQGQLLSGTIYGSNKAATLANELKETVKTYPLVAELVVPGDILPQSRLKIKAPGNLLYEKYKKLAGELSKKQGGTHNV